MAEAAFDGIIEKFFEESRLRFRQLVTVKNPDERTGLHAEFDGVEVHDKPIAPCPSIIAVSGGCFVAVLHTGGVFEYIVQLVEIRFGLADKERVGEKVSGGKPFVERFDSLEDF